MAGLYRRGKVYWARAQRKGRDERRSLQTANREVAEKRLRQWLDELDATAWGDKPRRSYAEAEEKFIREHLTTIKVRAAQRYGVSLKHLSEHFAGKMLHQITKAELSSFETKRRTQGVSAGTIRRDLACLSSMLTSCEDWEWIDDGGNFIPAYLRKRAKRGLREAPARTRYLTADEEAALLVHATEPARSVIAMAIDTGLRREELFSLEWHQIDLLRKVIATTTMTKSGRRRVVPLPARSAQYLAQSPRHLDTAHVLVNPDTGTRYVHMDKALKAAMRRAKVADLRWHDLRRTAGCRWLQRDGKSLAEVSMLLGHSSVTVTENRYAFLDADAVAESISAAQKPAHGTADSQAFTNNVKKLAR
jgi:integrase